MFFFFFFGRDEYLWFPFFVIFWFFKVDCNFKMWKSNALIRMNSHGYYRRRMGWLMSLGKGEIIRKLSVRVYCVLEESFEKETFKLLWRYFSMSRETRLLCFEKVSALFLETASGVSRNYQLVFLYVPVPLFLHEIKASTFRLNGDRDRYFLFFCPDGVVFSRRSLSSWDEKLSINQLMQNKICLTCFW